MLEIHRAIGINKEEQGQMQYSPVIGIPEPCQRATGLLIMPTVGYNAHCFLCNREILKYDG